MRKWFVGLVPLLLIAGGVYVYNAGDDAETAPREVVVVEENPTPPEESPKLYGINLDAKLVIEDVVKPNENLSTILSEYQVPLQEIDLLARKAQGIFDVRKINAHKPYKLICNLDTIPQFMIYEPNKVDYVIFDLQDSTSVYTGQKFYSHRWLWSLDDDQG